MKTLLFICIWAVTFPAMACTCDDPHDFKTKTDLQGYDFIALVKVKRLAPLDTVNRMFHLRRSGDIGVEVIELFKGEKADTVYDENFENDCAFHLEENAEWLFFGFKRDGKIYVSTCSYSVQYRAPDGYRDWRYLSGIKQLTWLQSIYGHTAAEVPEKEFYPNGKTEVQQSFKNRLLNGQRKIYYPDGKLWITEEFEKGARVGTRNIYAKTGQLIEEITYSDGYKKEMVAYHDTAETVWYLHYQASPDKAPLFAEKYKDPQTPLKELDSLRKLKNWPKLVMYDYKFIDKGYSYRFYACDFLGRMERSADMDWNEKVETTYEYFKNGDVQEYMKYDKKANKQTGYGIVNGQRHIFDRPFTMVFSNELAEPELVCVQ
jgi:antitoxin component YwqK of YwqJK toxin-antitoxin module